MYAAYSGSSAAQFQHAAPPTLTHHPRPVHMSSAEHVYADSPMETITAKVSTTTTKKPVRDSKRRATHSQIERRRREKINDRLVTLRTIVPACAAEVEERKRRREEEEEEARRIAAGEITASVARGGKRKRNRRRVSKQSDGDNKEEELGLHKLEVLTHAIEYIYELQARIYELETGVKSEVRRLDDDDDQTEIVDDPIEEHHQIRKRLEEEESSEVGMELEDARTSKLHSFSQGAQHAPHSLSLDYRPSVTRRSTTSSDGTSAGFVTSPAFPYSLSNHEEISPFFSATANSSVSNVTALTSPMMSLSAESPIFSMNANNGSVGSSTTATANAKATASKRPSSHHRHASSTTSEQREHAWPMLPEPVIPPSQQLKKQEHDDAHLLLAFSTSPEVLRPTSAVRNTYVEPESSTSTTTSIARQKRRLSATAAVASSMHYDNGEGQKQRHWQQQGSFRSHAPLSSSSSSISGGGKVRGYNVSLRTKKVDGRSMVLGSAPGGAHPSSSSSLLPSPPMFALDDKETLDAVEDEEMDAVAAKDGLP